MSVYTYLYDNHYQPPMPVVEFGLSRPGTAQVTKSMLGIIDSGADGTLVPVDVLEEVGARYVGQAFMRGISGTSQRADVYLADFHIGPHAVRAIRVVAVVGGSEIILGRNVLQHLVVTLNGPASVAEIAS